MKKLILILLSILFLSGAKNPEYIKQIKDNPKDRITVELGDIVEIRDGEEIIQEFTRGVLAINTNKSVYTLNETAYLQMAALRDDGHRICDANLELEITSPSAGQSSVSVQRSGKCP